MKKIVVIFGFIFLLLACTSKTIYKKPKDLISKERMVDIWTDIYIASAAKNTKTTSQRKNINYTPLVLEKYKIDSLRFSSSNVYYTSRIEEYEALFEEVQKRLESIKKRYDKNAVALDSIIKSNSNLEDEMKDMTEIKD